MMRSIYLAGGNTGDGFKGFYHELLAESRRALLIKGGPGVGKSTLMRRMGEMWEQAGEDVEYFMCSGDPDSVDGVYCPARGQMLLDGTAPHVVDPMLPGAADGILNLGDCLNLRALAEKKEEIKRLNRETSMRYARAYRLLNAARAMHRASGDLLAAALDQTEMRRVITRLFERAQWSPGHVRTLFAETVTCRGVMRYPDSILRGEIISLEAPWGFDMSALLSPLARYAAHMGFQADVFVSDLDAAVPVHLRVGGITITCAGAVGAERMTLPFDTRLLSAKQDEMAFDRAVHDLLISRAIDALHEANMLHDELENHYAGAMNYQQWDECYARATSVMAESGSSATAQPADASASSV